MSEELAKICRVCLAEGSRDIFCHRATNTDTISSLDRIVEKYRFVTMLKVQDTDNLPRMICDSCIVQLNVAYNFKLKAIESDTKLHQFIIEKGFHPHDYSMTAITDAPADPIRTDAMHPEAAAIASEYLRNFETPQSMASTTVINGGKSSIPFRCMPIQIKVEYIEEGEPSPTSSESNLHTVSDTSSVRSNEHLNGMVRVAADRDKVSDEEFVSHYIRPSPADTSPESSKSKQSRTSKNSNKDKKQEKPEEPKPKKEDKTKPETSTKGRKRKWFEILQLGNTEILDTSSRRRKSEAKKQKVENKTAKQQPKKPKKEEKPKKEQPKRGRKPPQDKFKIKPIKKTPKLTPATKPQKARTQRS